MIYLFFLNIGILLFAQEAQRVSELDISAYTIKQGNSCSIELGKNNTISMDAKTLVYYKKLSELDKKMYIRMAINGFLKKDVKKEKPFVFVYKENGIFYMESLAHVQLAMSDGLAVIKNFAEYHTWLLKDINIRRGGQGGSYFVVFENMSYKKDAISGIWDFLVKMNVVFGGLYTIGFRLEDKLNNDPVPTFSMLIKEPSSMVPEMSGHFHFLSVPCDNSFFVGYFYGETKLHWLLYKILSKNVVNSQVGERIETMLENIDYKADDVAIQKKRAKHINLSQNNLFKK